MLKSLKRWWHRRLAPRFQKKETGSFSDYGPAPGSTAEIFYYQTIGISTIRIVSQKDDGVCDPCRELHGKEFSFEEYRDEMPLPVDTCSKNECRCHSVPVF